MAKLEPIQADIEREVEDTLGMLLINRTANIKIQTTNHTNIF